MGEKQRQWVANLTLRTVDGANSHCFDGRLMAHDDECVGFVMRGGMADRRIRACVNALAGIPDPATFMADAYELLDRLEDYFDQRSDVADGDYGVPEPNAEMQHLTAIRELMAAMEKNNG